MKNKLILPLITAAVLLFGCNNSPRSEPVEKRVINMGDSQAGKPFSPAVEAGNMLFVSGQIAIDPQTGLLIEGGIEDQTRQVLVNLFKVIEIAGYKPENVVKSTVLMTDISHYQKINEIYMEYFSSDPPARAAYAVKDLPLGALIEIEAIAVR